MKIGTLLIANRGEIACRIARTARRLGIVPVGVHSDADTGALHVREIGQSIRIGPGPASESYLRIDAILDAARRAGADAIHPGYGFLSENPAFARAVEAAGLIFVGPTPETLERFGDKAQAKSAAIKAGVPVLPGSEGAYSAPAKIAAEVRRLGLPALLKAIGGGGGRGQRLVTSEATLTGDIEAALREARSTFGSEGLLIERFLPESRHIEIQIAGDGRGNVIHLRERDCTLQRRHQKVIEEAPAVGLDRALLDRIASDAVRLGRSVDYRGLGTVEFLVAGNDYFFLEVNPRLQVEHPVTEAITGLDLVALQLAIAAGEGLPIAQEDVRCDGHAIEARLYAEDPANQFAPSTGRIEDLILPDRIRVDSGVVRADAVTPFYDPMIAKLIVHAGDRAAALAALERALGQSAVSGVKTNRAFLRALLRDEEVAAMRIHTRWIDARLDRLVADMPGPRQRLWQAAAACLYLMDGRMAGAADAWRRRDIFTGWRLGLGSPEAVAGQRVTLSAADGADEEFRVSPIGPNGAFTVIAADGNATDLCLSEFRPGEWLIAHAGEEYAIRATVCAGEIGIETAEGRYSFKALPPLATATGESVLDGTLNSPLTGLIVKVAVAEGDPVTAGETVAILESMKLEISIKATTSGRAARIAVREGDMVDRGQTIAEIAPLEVQAT
ncbi:MAG TPA: biotin carboxylase N-terminal domain-containing protein [Ferrovibrio sp.]|uniref:acetyl/propionyl/methylcrotonyl-CoA carboxylase subunit alpha n=1 Tax=Ferrovibrio sp. TaxID=1917215 RepID=UPI002ED1A19D